MKALRWVFVLVVLARADALACSCANTSADVLFQRAEAVFAGKVLNVEGNKVTFEVEKSWKHVRSRRVAVYDTGEGSCRAVYGAGVRMIVHASVKDGHLYTHMCMGFDFDGATGPNPRFAGLEAREQLPIRSEDSASPGGGAGGNSGGASGRAVVLVIAGAVILLLLGVYLLIRRGARRAA